MSFIVKLASVHGFTNKNVADARSSVVQNKKGYGDFLVFREAETLSPDHIDEPVRRGGKPGGNPFRSARTPNREEGPQD